MKRLCIVGFLSIASLASAQDDFEAFKKQQESGYQTYQKEVEKGVLASIEDYENFRKKET